MITTPTTFVLGAGASKEYGFPLGKELIGSMTGQISSGDGRYKSVAGWISEPEEVLLDFDRKLVDSGIQTIDSWLSCQIEQSGFPRIGRTVIARAIHEHESGNQVRQGWYGVLWNRMHAGCRTLKEFSDNNRHANFVTFNYDRSLEYFLQRSVISTFPNAEADLRLLNGIGIIHIHGRVGRLAWQEPVFDGEPVVPFGGLSGNKEEHWKLTTGCVGSFRLQGIEDSVSARVTQVARGMMLHKTKAIYILGFGFHPDNVEKIKINGGSQQLQVSAPIFDSTIHASDLLDYTDSLKSPLGKAIAFTEGVKKLETYVDAVLRRLK